MDLNTALLAATVAGLVVLVQFAMARRRRRVLRDIEQRVDVLVRQLGLEELRNPTPSELAVDMLAQGRKIDAIRVYREDNPHLGLKGAKERIEAFERGASYVAPLDPGRVVQKLDAVLRALDLEPADPAPDVSDDVRHLARAGKKIDAIRQLRIENPGLGLAEAKDAVERL